MNELLRGRDSLRTLAEDETADLADVISAWWNMVPNRGSSIADILLMRACDKLDIEVNGVNAMEHIKRWKI